MKDKNKIEQAFKTLLKKVFGGEIPEGFSSLAVDPALFDRYRREVEDEFGLHTRAEEDALIKTHGPQKQKR